MGRFRVYTAEECAVGRDGYPAEWHERLKHEVRERAGHRCVRCLHPYGRGAGKWSPCDDRCEHSNDAVRWKNRMGVWTTVPLNLDADAVREAEWRILTVHHLDGNKANCRWWNLAALCQRCHLEIQGKVRMERRWQHEHSDWFKPYVAGYYAFTFLRQDLTRREVLERLDELLALEDRQLPLGV